MILADETQLSKKMGPENLRHLYPVMECIEEEAQRGLSFFFFLFYFFLFCNVIPNSSFKPESRGFFIHT